MNDLTTTDSNMYGPAMQKLNERQRAFVIARVWKGLNQTECARDAGYAPSGTNNSLAVIGHNLANDLRVIEAIREETNKLKDSQGAASIRTLVEIRDDPTTEKRDRIKCAKELLDRSGYHKQTEHTVHVTKREMTSEEMVARIILLAKNQGLDPEKLLGRSVVVDANFEEVPHELTEADKKQKAARDRENELRRLKRRMTPEEWETHNELLPIV